jgi:hypothetical protein
MWGVFLRSGKRKRLIAASDDYNQIRESLQKWSKAGKNVVMTRVEIQKKVAPSLEVQRELYEGMKDHMGQVLATAPKNEPDWIEEILKSMPAEEAGKFRRLYGPLIEQAAFRATVNEIRREGRSLRDLAGFVVRRANKEPQKSWVEERFWEIYDSHRPYRGRGQVSCS